MSGAAEPEIVVEFPDRPGLRQVGLADVDLPAQSAKAFRKAMSLVRTVTDDMHDTISEIAHRPDKVEVAFGVKFDSEIGAFVAKASVEAAITVTLTWGNGDEQ